MKIIIAGGGIGGLVTALSLHAAGMDVSVFESVDEVKPLGVGINLLPHSVRVLTRLGLHHQLEKIAVETSELIYANKLGQVFWSEPRGRFAGYKWPQFSVHRGKLQLMLWEVAKQKLGPERLHTNCHLSAVEQHLLEVQATFVNKGGAIARIEKADLLIGADGINSVLRKLLYPDEGDVKYSGNILYRGTARMKPFLSGTTMVMIGAHHQKMVVYPIDNEPDDDGNVLINWVANLRQKGTKLKVRDWNRQVGNEWLIDLYQDWKFDWIDIPGMIKKTTGGIFEFPMADRDPLLRWSFNRVTLLGDAAHAMYPIGSNGASQAILDADALTRALQNESNPIKALENYDEERVYATMKIVLQNREDGPDIIMDIMEDRFPHGFTPEQIPKDEISKVMKFYKEIAGFDIDTLNSKP